MTPAAFRRIALGLKDTVEHRHHDHPDFRVGGRIFATLGYPNGEWAMVVLTPEQQRGHVREYPDAFAPVKGAWGQKGCTSVRLAVVEEEALGQALTLARQHAVAKGPTRPARPGPRTAAKRAARRSTR